jgi:hypothetical protein
MRCLLPIFIAGLLVLIFPIRSTYSQTPEPVRHVADAADSRDDGTVQAQGAGVQLPPIQNAGFSGMPTPTPVRIAPQPALFALEADLREKNQELQQARAEAAQTDAKPGDTLETKVALLQKQIALQQKMIQLLLDQMKKAPAGGPAIDDLQGKVATLESRTKQGAQRDQDLAQAVDNLTEHADAEARNGPRLPAALKELFLGSRNNETPLSIYGSFVENYSQPNGRNGTFGTPDFAPYFLLQLNEQFLLAANIDISNNGVSVGEAQVDWLVADWMTVVLGRFLTPIGFFNERLNHEWINRLPDVPLMFRQVVPLLSTDGLMVRGGVYLFGSPVKIEYALYGGNGAQATAGPPPGPTTYSEAVDLQGITGGSDETSLQSMGGRVGFWIPEWGIQGGISGYSNGRYSSLAKDQFDLWDLDLNYRKGNWDLRFEYAENYQQAVSYIGNNVRRKGFYTQIAYRPYDLEHCILKNIEVAVRYSRVWFHGIDPTQIDPTAFSSPMDVPVNRDQWTFGMNYYFYPSMALRLAYEVNHELGNINLHDNIFLAQYVWAF